MEEKKAKKIKIIPVIFLIIILVIAVILIKYINDENSKNIENDSYTQSTYNVKNVVENIEESEKNRIAEEVIEKLNKKYGGNNNFEVLNIEKGSRSGLDYDVYIDEKYFNLFVRMIGTEFNTDFTVDYIKNTDTLIQSLQSNYEQNIINRLKSINNNINTINYNLSDYNGLLGNSGKEYMSLDAVYGKIPSQEDIDLLVQDLHIYCKYSEEVKDSEETRNFINNVKPDIKELYNYISQNFPRIPQGTGTTSVEIVFGNGVTLRIFPLSNSILAIQGSNTIEYNWSDIL